MQQPYQQHSGVNMGYQQRPGPPPYRAASTGNMGYQPRPGGMHPRSGSGMPPHPGGMVPRPPMPPPPPPCPGIPPGLELLAQTNMIFVMQEVELLEIMIGWETANRYRIMNHQGMPMFYCKEINDACTLLCCGPTRPFGMEVVDIYGRQVMYFTRHKRCSEGCYAGCCGQEMDISVLNQPAGQIKQKASCGHPFFVCSGPDGKPAVTIEGPFCIIDMCGEVEFIVRYVGNPNPIGRIAKHWSGLVKELFTDADNFGIEFPMSLDVRLKAVLVGACILIDFMYFEEDPNANR